MSITSTHQPEVGVEWDRAELLIKEAREASRRRRQGWSAFFIVGAVAATLITSIVVAGSKTSSQIGSGINDASRRTMAATARALCHELLGPQALNSEPAKVSTVHQFGYGPADFHPAPNAFPGLGANQIVGLCWTGSPNTGYRLYAVASHYRPVRIEGVMGVGFKSTPAPGFIDIP
jgi:hypothetical protein